MDFDLECMDKIANDPEWMTEISNSELMRRAGTEMGLSTEQAYKLAVGTFVGASALAQASNDPPELLRERVTSKGGTTYAAITSMQADGVQDLFVKALHAACKRAEELGNEFGK